MSSRKHMKMFIAVFRSGGVIIFFMLFFTPPPQYSSNKFVYSPVKKNPSKFVLFVCLFLILKYTHKTAWLQTWCCGTYSWHWHHLVQTGDCRMFQDDLRKIIQVLEMQSTQRWVHHEASKTRFRALISKTLFLILVRGTPDICSGWILPCSHCVGPWRS